MSPKLVSSFTHKCPRCLRAGLFPDPNPYHLTKTAVMYERCPVCDLNFIPEPGYYYGAMYVSYAMTIALGVALFVLHYLVHKQIRAVEFMIELTVILLLTAPYTFRTSRAVWLNIFVKYDPQYAVKK